MGNRYAGHAETGADDDFLFIYICMEVGRVQCQAEIRRGLKPISSAAAKAGRAFESNVLKLVLYAGQFDVDGPVLSKAPSTE